ncbi:uncharacterized protein LOC113067551 [Tachysurus ichikawai]
MWQGLRTICAFGNKSSADVRPDPLLADELNTFYGRFESNLSSASLPISASGSSSQISDNQVIAVSEDECLVSGCRLSTLAIGRHALVAIHCLGKDA